MNFIADEIIRVSNTSHIAQLEACASERYAAISGSLHNDTIRRKGKYSDVQRSIARDFVPDGEVP